MLFEARMPVYYINQNMLDYLGYEYGEFEKATGNLIVNCIDPGDCHRWSISLIPP